MLTIFTVNLSSFVVGIGTPLWLIGVCVVLGLIVIVVMVFTISIIWYKVKNKGILPNTILDK